MQISLKSIFLSSCLLGAMNASSAPECQDENKVLYVNGIQNTYKAALEAADELKRTLDKSETRSSVTKRKFTVELVYNPHGFTGKEMIHLDLFQDLRELMVEKTSEELYATDFAKLISPHNHPIITDHAAAERVKKFVDDMTPGVTSIEASGDVSDKNLKASQEVVATLVDKFKANTKVIVVAHSQGNILSNLAYASYAADTANDPIKNVRIVNVGNTSNFSVNNLNLSHANDAALGSLIQLPKTKSWKRTTPDCLNDECEFKVAKPTFAGAAGNDVINHGFIETYLSTNQLPTINDDQGVGFTSGKNRFVDRLEDLVYAALKSLDAQQGVNAAVGLACIKLNSATCSIETNVDGIRLSR